MTEQAGPRKKGRSPNYPAIDLRASLKRAESVLQAHKMHLAPIDSVVACWGYKSHRSGVAATQYASLKKFGLLIEQGAGESRQAQVSDLARAILQNPDEEQRSIDIRRAALLPALHLELWEKYGADIPPDPALKYALTVEHGFTESGAGEFIKQYRSTIDFAFGTEREGPQGRRDSGVVEDRSALMHHTARPVDVPREPQSMRIPIPLVGGHRVVIEGPFPISGAAWENLLSVLAAMEPGLTEQGATVQASDGPSGPEPTADDRDPVLVARAPAAAPGLSSTQMTGIR